MNKRQWFYVAPNGAHTSVGLMHHPTKGHLMIYCGSKVVLVEFKVLGSKTFSFFLEEELFKVSVTRTATGYEYDFGVDMEADTPLNEERRTLRQRDHKRGLLAFVGLVAAITLVIVAFVEGNQTLQARARARDGVTKVATIYLVEHPSSYSLTYDFPTPAGTWSRQVEYYRRPHPLAPNGFPLYTGDEFKVVYQRTDPANSKVHYDEPTAIQLSKYYDRTRERHQALNPGLSANACDCTVRAAYRVGGLTALAYLYHQDAPPMRNWRYNRRRYRHLVADDAYQTALARCTEQQQTPSLNN